MPFAGRESIDGNQTPFLILGISFWTTFLSSYIILFIINHKRKKKVETTHNIKNIGFFKINSNRFALIFDVIMVFSLIPIIIMLFVAQSNTLLYIFSFIFVFSIQMHGVFNGQNFKYIFSELENRRKNK
jgi:hypothetical protein